LLFAQDHIQRYVKCKKGIKFKTLNATLAKIDLNKIVTQNLFIHQTMCEQRLYFNLNELKK